MSVRGLSAKIEKAIDSTIEGLQFPFKISEMDDGKMKASIKSKISSFNSSKKLLDKWVNGPNAPSQRKIITYTKRLIKAGYSAMKNLEEGLEKKINYSELDDHEHARAVEAKPFILDSIHQLNSGIIELELQLDNDEINFKDKEFKVGWPERCANGELFPIDTYHKNWYNEKKDAIKIDPLGSEGEIVELYGIKIQLPEKPVSKNNILFSDLPKKEQYWRRQPMPKGLNQETEDEYIDYIVEEFKRRIHGVWFMNNGKAVYLTGDMYFWLNWYKDIDSGQYSDFRYAQLNLSYHTKACEVDKRCLGQAFIKSRRTGFTLEKLSRKLNKETMNKNFRSGLTSKSGDDAEEAFKKKQYAFANLPFFFKPVVKGREDSATNIFFAKPTNASKEAKKNKDKDVDDYLNTLSDMRKTVNDAYDSTKLNDYLADESGKWSGAGADFLSHFAKVIPTMDENGIIVGKAWLGSTLESRDKGGRAMKVIWDGSDPLKRNKVTKRTSSGLYRYFLGVHENSKKHTDRYGVCHTKRPPGQVLNQGGEIITEGSIDYYEELEKEAAAKSQEDHNEYLRNHPRKIEHAFRDKIEDSAFDLNRIQDQLDYLDLLDGKTVRGDFYRKGGTLEGEVAWKPNTKGRFLVSWLPDENLRNKHKYIGAHKAPANEWLGAGGLDPYGKDKTMDGRGSKGSLHFINRPNAHAPETSNMFVLEYIYRPPTIRQFYEDCLMAAEFYGYPIFYESDKSGIETYFEERNRLEYLMLRPDRFKPKNSRLKKERGAPSRGIMIDAVYYALQAYINKYVGKLEDEKIGNMFFKKTLEDWLRFEPNNRTAYDASISSGFALCAIQVEPKKKLPEIDVQQTPFRFYDNRGTRSRLK